MGLDMSLYRAKKMKGKSLTEIIEFNERYYEDNLTGKELVEIEPYLIQIPYGKALLEEKIYWRKANAIHKWFVDNIQNGNDDCGYYKVEKKDIEKLLKTLNKVYKSLKNKKRVTQVFKDYNNKIYEEECYSPTDLKIAEKLLPTQDGFFFGGINYNDYYYEMVVYTIEKCEKIIKRFDFENDYLFYHSSW